MNRSFQLLPEQGSAMAARVDALVLFLLAITVFFTLLVLVLVAYFALRYRRHSTDFVSPNPPATQTNVALEIAWTLIPLLIVMVLFVWGTRLYVEESRPPAGAMEVHVIGRQWMWKVQHPDGRREINELTVPVGRAVKLVMTSEDVVHSFGIPAFRITQDVIPGRYSYEWFEPTRVGEYHLFCREYCGTQHSGMIGTVRVLKQADYDAWLAGRPADAVTPVQAGAALFEQFSCSRCHGINAPTLAGVYNTKVDVLLSNGTERSVTADEDYLRESILYPRAKIVKGFPPGLMPTFQGQITEEQLVSLVEYIKSMRPGGPAERELQPGQRMQEQSPRPPELSTGQSGNTGKR
jgi:cytochrome c oxidase subunit 2